MGSIFKPKVPAAPPPPPPPELVSFTSEISGVQRIPVKDAEGKTTIVEKRFLTPEQQAIEDNLQRIGEESLGRIETLSNNFDLDLVPGGRDMVDAFRSTQREILDTAFQIGTRAEEESLARFGVADSLAASTQRAQRSGRREQSEIQLGRDLETLEQGIRQEEIGRQVGLFGLVTGRQDVAQQQLANTLARGAGTQQGLLGAQTQYNNAIFQSQLAQQQQQTDASQTGFGNLASTIGLAGGLAGPSGFGLIGGAGAGAGLAAATLPALATPTAIATTLAPLALASDVNVKENIQHIYNIAGIPVYAYEYIDGVGPEGRHVGVMAQDIEKIIPEAVVEVDGIKRVDYSKVFEHIEKKGVANG